MRTPLSDHLPHWEVGRETVLCIWGAATTLRFDNDSVDIFYAISPSLVYTYHCMNDGSACYAT